MTKLIDFSINFVVFDQILSLFDQIGLMFNRFRTVRFNMDLIYVIDFVATMPIQATKFDKKCDQNSI